MVSENGSGRQAAAAWTAACGAFLLVSAAAVFVAARWDALPGSARFGVVVLVTAACLSGGLALRRSLPVTGTVVAHLGAVLVPVDAAAMGVRAGLGWRGQALVVPLAATVTFVVAGGLWRSRPLLVGAAVAAAGACGGAAAVTPAPAPLLVAGLAAAALAAGHRRLAVGWALAAASAPVATATAPLLWRALATSTGRVVLADLGLAGPAAARWAAASGVVAAAVLAVEAARRADARLGAASPAAALAGLAAALGWGEPGTGARLLAPAALLLAVEVVAWLTERDRFWAEPLALAAEVAEWLAVAVVGAPALAVAGGLLAEAALGEALGRPPGTAAPAALALTAFGLAVAAARHGSRTGVAGSALVTLPAAAVAGFTAAGLAGLRAPAVLIGIGLAAGLVVTGTAVPARVLDRPAGTVLATGLPVLLVDDPGAMALAAVAAVLVAGAASATSRTSGEAFAHAGPAAVAAMAAGVAAGAHWGEPAGLAVVAAAGVLLAANPHRSGGVPGAALVLGAAAVAPSVTPGFGAWPAAAGAAGLIAVAAARRDALLAGAGAAATHGPLGAALLAAGLGAPWTGFGLVVAAVVWFGLSEVAPGLWPAACRVATGAGIAAGLSLAADDGLALADSLVLAGLVALAAGLRHAPPLAAAGLLATCGGALGHLLAAGVDVAEPYAAVASLPGVAVGLHARRHGDRLPSAVTFAPAVVFVGGAALVERWTGGPGWHGIVAGAVAVAAVAAGAVGRLAGPLVAGTGLLVAVVAHETLDQAAQVPTWAWLAAGGVALLALGVGVERSDRSPAETGRRLVETLRDRFE